jgi:hypothetical protein
MNSRTFAKAWLEKEGLFDKDSAYEGWLGECVMQVVELVASQGHSGASAGLMYALLERIFTDYNNADSPIWKSYWESDEGKALLASMGS